MGPKKEMRMMGMRSRVKAVLATAAFFAVVAIHVPAMGFTVAVRGEAPACSVVTEARWESAKFAAEELVSYVERMTGVRLPIAEGGVSTPLRLVLASGDADLGDDGFRLRALGDTLAVYGGKRGVLYGVYELLERFGGCGWFSSWCEVVPKTGRFTVPDGLDSTQKPAFAVRESGWKDAWDNPGFAAKLRLNNRSFRHEVTKLGGSACRFGACLWPCHTFEKLLPPEKCFDAHPEWYSEVGGKRLKVKTQLCLTNPEVVAAVASNVLAAIRRDPEAPCYGVSQNDWFNYCTCDRCKALDDAEESHAGTMISFVNQIAEIVERECPGKVIETLAYQYTRKPPKTVRPRRNVLVCLCAMEVDQSRPIPESKSAESVAFTKEIKAWSKICDRLYVWDYDTNFTHALVPHPYYRQLQGNLRFYRDMGVYFVYGCANNIGHHGEFAELKNYLLAKWLWNPELPADMLIDRFFRGYYGAAAPIVRRHFDDIIRYQMEAGNPVFTVYEQTGRLSRIYPADFFRKAAQGWRRAETAVKGDLVRLYNVKTSSMPTDYMIYMQDYRTIFLSKGDQDKGRESRQALERLVSNFELAEKEGRAVAICDGVARSLGKLNRIKEDAKGGGVIVGNGKSVVIEEKDFEYTGYSASHVQVDDPEAGDGRAVVIANGFYDWSTYVSLNRVAFRPGRKYRIRVRCKAKLTGERGIVFEPNVFDYAKNAYIVQKHLNNSTVGEKYADYDVLEWTPGRDNVLHLTCGWWDKKRRAYNPTHTGIWVDRAEIVELQ